LLEVLLGPEGRRRLELRDKTNDELFTLYDADLVLKNNHKRSGKDSFFEHNDRGMVRRNDR